MVTRRHFLASAVATGAGLWLGPAFRRTRLFAEALLPELSDPALQPKFTQHAPNALAPGFKYTSPNDRYRIAVRQATAMTGLRGPDGFTPVPTPVFAYGDGQVHTWPGRTFELQRDTPIRVLWDNLLIDGRGKMLPHVLTSLAGESVVDTSLHWAYSLHGYEQYSIANDGVPIVTHLHGGHTRPQFDGNPEYFFSPRWRVKGPRWVSRVYDYANDQPAGTLWYHDHALGITRLNVYAGMAGFYFVRDAIDTGTADNPLGLPAYPYELAYAIQDRMFKKNGELFYPAFPGDPFWTDFITDEGLADDEVPQPSALAEFFGDHMLVNGKIWPKADVEPRHYRLRLLNGCDSRFMVIRFRPAATPDATTLEGAGDPLPFWIIGADQGLAGAATQLDALVFEPGGRYDVVIDFSQVPAGTRIIVENLGGDAPFGGDFGASLPPGDFFPDRQTDRIMAFDVVLPFDANVPDAFDPAAIGAYTGNDNPVDRVRRVALFEGKDEYGRLQPLLGVAEPTLDAAGDLVDGAIAWHAPTTENPAYGATEVWEIYNATADAHPVHLHLVNFEVLQRQRYNARVVPQPVEQHNGTFGQGFRLERIRLLGQPRPRQPEEYAPRDMVTALPGEVTSIKATFDIPGRYVWHCHILSHEDHEMMRVLHVGPGA